MGELAKRLKQAETLNVDLQRRVDELNSELQAAHNDSQRAQAELARLRVSLGELQERCDALTRDNKQLSGESFCLLTDDQIAYCVTFAESEPYCRSILSVWMSVGHSATYSLP